MLSVLYVGFCFKKLYIAVKYQIGCLYLGYDKNYIELLFLKKKTHIP